MKHNMKNGKISNGGKSGKYTLSEPLTLLQESCFFFKKKRYRHLRMSCTRREVKTVRTERVAQTHIFLVHTDQRTCVGLKT